jgi:hypothetical protein
VKNGRKTLASGGPKNGGTSIRNSYSNGRLLKLHLPDFQTLLHVPVIMRLGYRRPMDKIGLYARMKAQVCFRSGDEKDCFGVQY